MVARRVSLVIACTPTIASASSPSSSRERTLAGLEVLRAAPPSASPGATSVELRWSAPASCPTQVQVANELAKFHIDANEGAGEIEGRARVHARVRKDGAEYVLLLDVTLPDGMVSQRLRSTNCEALASAGMLTVAVLTDPSHVEREIAMDTTTSRSAGASPPQPGLGDEGEGEGAPSEGGVDTQSNGDAAQRREGPHRGSGPRETDRIDRVVAQGTRTPLPREGELSTDERIGVPVPGGPRRLGPRIGVAGILGAGELPRMHAGGQLAAGVRLMPGRGRFRSLRAHGPELALAVWSAGPAYARERPDNELARAQWPTARADLLAITASLRECWEPALAGPRPKLCGGVRAGVVRGVGRGVPISSAAYSPIVGLLVAAAAVIPVGRRAQIHLGFELEWAPLRPRFEIAGLGGLARGIPFGGRAVLGVHWGLGVRPARRDRARKSPMTGATRSDIARGQARTEARSAIPGMEEQSAQTRTAPRPAANFSVADEVVRARPMERHWP